jgi:hypothetical protein
VLMLVKVRIVECLISFSRVRANSLAHWRSAAVLGRERKSYFYSCSGCCL